MKTVKALLVFSIAAVLSMYFMVSSLHAQSFSLSWDDGVPPDVKHYTMTLPPDALGSLAGAVALVTPTGVAPPIRPPQIVLPGDGSRAKMPDGSVISVGANGEVYKDALQLGATMARQVIQYGNTVYAQGKTNPLWWRWTGSTWTQATAYDVTILKDYVAPASASMMRLQKAK